MTDIKETIQGLYSLKTYLASKAIEEHGIAKESLIGMQKVVDSAVNLLKEQEPIAPSVCGSKDDELSCWWYMCGKCKMPIAPKERFCRRCGQAVK